MTIQEMYQEMKEQYLEDILNGYVDKDIYDDCNIFVDIDYTTQEQYKSQVITCHFLNCPLPLDFGTDCCHTTFVHEISDAHFPAT